MGECMLIIGDTFCPVSLCWGSCGILHQDIIYKNQSSTWMNRKEYIHMILQVIVL